MKVHSILAHITLLATMILSGCNSIGLDPQVTQRDLAPQQEQSSFKLQARDSVKHFASSDTIKTLSNNVQNEYHLGPGDIMDISVWNRQEISRTGIVVSPDGKISLPKVGVISVLGKTVNELSREITEILTQNYESPEATIIVREFHNNKAFVLGRVSEPGVVNFPGEGTLLEALALAGGLPHIGKETFLTKCAIIRGKETIIWIDLRDLLDNGNMALNARIINDDVIFIPEAEDEMVMVLGEVDQPGPVMLKRGLNLVDAIMRAGGYTTDSNLSQVYIIRRTGDHGEIQEVDIKSMLESGDFSRNYALMQDDIVYVAPSGMKEFNYALQQIMPSLQILTMSSTILDNFGLTNRIFTLEEGTQTK